MRQRGLLLCTLALSGLMLGAVKDDQYKVVQDWSDPAFEKIRFKKLLVVGITENAESRRRFEEQVISLQEAVRLLTSLASTNLKITGRGALEEGFFADVVIFDPDTVADKATFEQPHQYSVGVRDVIVNGVPVLRDGEHTGATPGRFVKGPGYTGE